MGEIMLSELDGPRVTTCVRAKSLQPCPTRCDPTDCSPPGFSGPPWDSTGDNTGGGCHALLQGIFPTQGLNLCPLHPPVLAGRFFTAGAT